VYARPVHIPLGKENRKIKRIFFFLASLSSSHHTNWMQRGKKKSIDEKLDHGGKRRWRRKVNLNGRIFHAFLKSSTRRFFFSFTYKILVYFSYYLLFHHLLNIFGRKKNVFSTFEPVFIIIIYLFIYFLSSSFGFSVWFRDRNFNHGRAGVRLV
jgi:hypothetical protein